MSCTHLSRLDLAQNLGWPKTRCDVERNCAHHSPPGMTVIPVQAGRFLIAALPSVIGIAGRTRW
jgi:hypothetical protein